MPRPISIVVDDESGVRQFIRAVLQRERFHVLEAEDGWHGLEIIKQLRTKLDLVVTDIQMPNCDGITFARAVKKALPTVPIIIVSGYADEIVEFDGFLKKPFLPDALLAAVQSALSSQGAVTGAS